MKNPMNKRLPRELKSDFGKYLVIFLFIVMVVSVVSGFLIANDGVGEAYYRLLDEGKVEDGHMAFNVEPGEEFLNGIAEKADVTLYREPYFDEETDGARIRVYTLGGSVNIPEVTEGRLPEANDEIVLDNLHTTTVGIKVGDRITLGGRSLLVTGLAAFPNYSALFKDNADLMFDIETFGVGIMTKDGFTAFASDHEAANYAWVYNQKPKTDAEKNAASEKVINALREELTKSSMDILARSLKGEKGLSMIEVKDYLATFENKCVIFAEEDMNSDSASMIVFLYIVVAVLAFIVAITTINTLSRESSVIGTLRASGYTRGEMIRHYMVLPLTAFFTGMLVGNVLGYTFILDYMKAIYDKMYSVGKVRTSWNANAFLQTTLVPAIIMIAINYAILAWKMRLGPLRFLRRDISGRNRKRAVKLSEKIPFTGRFRIRIIFQNMSNYITMAVGIVLAGAIIIFGLMFEPLLNTIADRIEETGISRYQYILKTPEEAESDAERFVLSSLETTKKGYKTDEVSVYGIVPESSFVKADIPEGKVLLSNSFMDKYNVKKGDTVTLYDKYADRNYTFTVAGEYPYEASLAVFMNLSDSNELFERAADYYNGYFADRKLTELTPSNVYMTLDAATFRGVADQLWNAFADFMEPVKWFGVIMFVLMVYLLAKQIIERNQTSISMAKILGFTGGEIGGLYIAATSIVVVLSLFLAVPLVNWLLRLIFKEFLYQRISGYMPYCISNDCYWKMILIGLLSYVVVVVMQLLKIRRIPKSDALKTVE